MEITPEQLRYLREQRDMTRDDLAAFLGGCTGSTVNKWERGMHPIPGWVADKMFAKMPITFTVEQLSEMYDICRAESFTMQELIQESVAKLIADHRSSQTPQATKNPQSKGYGTNIVPLDKVAEDPPKPPRRKNGTED